MVKLNKQYKKFELMELVFGNKISEDFEKLLLLDATDISYR